MCFGSGGVRDDSCQCLGCGYRSSRASGSLERVLDFSSSTSNGQPRGAAEAQSTYTLYHRFQEWYANNCLSIKGNDIAESVERSLGRLYFWYWTTVQIQTKRNDQT